LTSDFNAVSALFGALLGVLLAWGLWRVQQWAQLRERRKNLATAMLVELWSLDWTLRRIAEDEEAAISRGSLPSSLFAEAHRVALDMPPATIHRILLFRGLCNDLDIRRANVGRDFEKARGSTESQALLRFKQRSESQHYYVRAKAAMALSIVPALFDDLKRAGGVWSDPGPVVTDGTSLPALPRSPFHHSDAPEQDEDAT
jgi:hypothetical protein